VSTGQPAQVPAGNHYGITVTYLQANVPAACARQIWPSTPGMAAAGLPKRAAPVDAGANTITAWPDHFSLWAALAEPLPTECTCRPS